MSKKNLLADAIKSAAPRAKRSFYAPTPMKNMYRYKNMSTNISKINNSVIGEPIERKVERLISNGEPIDSNGQVPMIYTAKSEGVLAGYNIRTDRFEVAADVADKINKGRLAKSESKAKQSNAPKADTSNGNSSGDGGSSTSGGDQGSGDNGGSSTD
jgi:uncharacterized membrane protein YgcG